MARDHGVGGMKKWSTKIPRCHDTILNDAISVDRCHLSLTEISDPNVNPGLWVIVVEHINP